MTSHESRPDDETSAQPADGATEVPQKSEVSFTRRYLWVGGVGVGAYMVLRGLWGVVTGEDDQP